MVEAEHRQPVGAIEGDEAEFIEKEGAPAGLRGVEQPGGAIEMRRCRSAWPDQSPVGAAATM